MTPVCPVCGFPNILYFHKKNYYVYFRCPECKLVFLQPVPSVQKIASLYDKHYEFRVDKTAQARFTEQAQSVLKKIRTYAPMSQTLLDIGAGFGTFVKLAKQHGFNPLGLEPAKNLYRIAKKDNLKMLNLGFETYFLQNPKSKFDVISLIHVVEHLREPEKALRKIIGRLKPNGVLFIETPNADSHLFNVEGPEYTFLTPPDHIHLFSAKSLESLVRGLGHDVSIHTTTYSYPEHFVGIVRRIKNGEIGKISKKQAAHTERKNLRRQTATVAPSFDSRVAPPLTPLLNLGNKGSILQMFVSVL